MPKAPNQKYKLFYILELLRSESDRKTSGNDAAKSARI